MKKSRRALEGKLALELIEETVHLLRLVPVSTLLCYYAGSLPFVLGLLYFWSDMSQSAFAQDRLPGAAFALAVLFLWMKTWHCRFALGLRAQLGNEPPPRWNLRRWLHTALIQGILQPAGLFLLLPALAILLPFGWIYAFFQNVTALGGDGDDVRTLFGRARRQTMLWPVQNHIALLTLKLFALFVLFNLVSVVIGVPVLLKMLLGIETMFTRLMNDPEAFLAIIFNTTFCAAIVSLTYLCVDPLLKALYVLRCFYGEALHTGQDLKTELRVHAKTGVAVGILACLLLTPLSLGAAARSTTPTPDLPAAVTSPELDRSIDETIRQREYSWRLPRPAADQTKKSPGLVASFFEGLAESLAETAKTIGRWLKRVVDWLGGLRQKPKFNTGSGAGWMSAIHGLVVILFALLVAVIVLLLIRLWQRRRKFAPDETTAQAVLPVPDVADENVAANQLPEDGWLTLARELMGQGEFRLALRALYLASLAHLAARNFIVIARFKSNRDYERELERRAHALPELFQLFRLNVADFDRVWYGLHDVNRALLDQFAHNVDRIRSSVVSRK